MSWLSVFVNLLSLLGTITKWLQQRQLIKAGEASTINAMLEGANEAMRKANEARANARRINDAGGLFENDGYRRD